MIPAADLAFDVLPLAVVVAGALLCGVALWQYFALRTRVSRGRAFLLAGLRTTALALVCVLLLGPRLLRRTFPASRPPISVAIDVSRSMGLKGGLAHTRLERVQAFLRSDAFRSVAADYLPEFHAFADSTAKVAGGKVDELGPQGARTVLEASLPAASSRESQPAAVVVFTDGGHGTPGADAPAAEPGVPVVVVGVGGGEKIVDVGIEEVSAPPLAFTGQPLQLQVSVRAAGLGGREVPVLLKRGGQALVSKTVTLTGGETAVTVPLEWVPTSPGVQALTVEIPVQEGELIAENNRSDVSVEAVRDKIRVLLVSGSPSWSYRFLRGALKGDPSVDLVSFIILRSAADAVDVPQQDLSLIPFPTQKIFLEELPNFDLLIFDNFSYQPYLPVQYLEKLQAFVRAGGTFWMLGGPQSFSGGRYGRSPIASLLPVALPDPAPAGGGFRLGSFQARLTAAGKGHPFFQGIADRDAPLPPLEGYNEVGAPRPGAVVLAEIPTAGGRSEPLIVLGRHGEGRVLAVLSDTLWKWAFEEAGRGLGNRAYLSFVRQALRWSVGDAQLQPVRVEIERAGLAPGDRIRARIHVLGEDFLPARAPELSVVLRGPGGLSRALVATPEGEGVFRVEGETGEAGTYEIAVEAASRRSVYGRAATTAKAAWPPEEFRAPGLNRDALAAFVARHGGTLLELGEDAETARALAAALAGLAVTADTPREEARPLSEDLRAFLLFLAVLGAEWVLRRRSGLD